MKKIFAALATVLLLTSMYVAFIRPVKAEARSDLDVSFYASDTAAWTALLGGQADFIQWALTKEQKEAAELNPNIQLCRVDENGYYEFDVNNNYTIISYPGVRSATNELEVREAIAELVDKDYIVANILLYFGVRIDVPIAAPQTTAWANASVIGLNYDYKYSPEKAMIDLAEYGFNDTDGNGYLNYPASWDGAPGADTSAYPLVVCVRSDHAHRLAAGLYLISQLETTLAGVVWPSLQVKTETLKYENVKYPGGLWESYWKPWVPLSEAVRVNGILKVRGVDYTVDYAEGEVKFTTNPAPGDTVTATFTVANIKVGGFCTTKNQWVQPRAILSPKVMGNRDYNVYTGGWSVGRYPTYLYSMYNSAFWYPYGPNYITGFDKNGNPMYPDVDAATAAIWYTASIATAKTAAQYFCYLHQLYCLQIPLWSYSSYWAYAKTLVGVVNEDGYGIENAYTFLNAYRVGGGPIRIATISGPDRLNILHSQWYFEYAFLDRVYTGGMSVQPYDLAVDQPWVIQDWDVSTWDDAGTTKSMVTYYIRKDVGIVTPVTGDYIRKWDAHDFEFTIWYNYAFSDSWQFGSFQDVKYTKIVDVNGDGWDEIQVYFDDSSYWFYSAPTYPLLTKDELILQVADTTTETWVQTGTATHNVELSVIKICIITLDDAPLQEGIDFEIYAGYTLASHRQFKPLHDLTGTISITYDYANIPSTGFYLAGLPWQMTMFSLGTHYPVSMTTDPPGIGDTIVCAKNWAFFMETPLLGEIDWAWKWGTGAKPRSGNYKIEIFDVVRATGAYCTRGDGTFNPKFFPGADIDQTDLCHIGIFDLVSITGKYGKTFGTPPDVDPELMNVGQGQTSATSTPWLGLVGSTSWTELVGPVNLATLNKNLATGVVSASLSNPALTGYAKGTYKNGNTLYAWIIVVKSSPTILAIGQWSLHLLFDVGQGHNSAVSAPLPGYTAGTNQLWYSDNLNLQAHTPTASQITVTMISNPPTSGLGGMIYPVPAPPFELVGCKVQPLP